LEVLPAINEKSPSQTEINALLGQEFWCSIWSLEARIRTCDKYL